MAPRTHTAAVYYSRCVFQLCIPVGWNWIATNYVVMLPPPLDSEARRTVEVEPRRPIDVSEPSESLWPWRMRAPHARRLCPRPLRPRVFRQHLRFRGLPSRLLPSIRRAPPPVRQSRDVPPKDLALMGSPRGRVSGSPSVKVPGIGTTATVVEKLWKSFVTRVFAGFFPWDW